MTSLFVSHKISKRGLPCIGARSVGGVENAHLFLLLTPPIAAQLALAQHLLPYLKESKAHPSHSIPIHPHSISSFWSSEELQG